MGYLSTYLNDHYAGSTAGVELAKRAAGNNRDEPEFGPPLERIATEIAEDREELKRLMDRFEVSSNRVKAVVGWVVEQGARLKPNLHVREYSPLSRLVELEGLLTGVNGKHSMWRALLVIAPHEARLDEASLRRLAERAEDQLGRLNDLRNSAAGIALMR